MPLPASGRWVLVFALICCALGLGISVELTRIHVLTHTAPDFHPICKFSEAVNCETVALSPYSIFLGLPVSVWGVVGYVVMAALAASGLARRRRPHPRWPFGALTLLTAGSAGVSAILGTLSAVRIDALCLFCVATYVVNLCLLVATVVGVREIGGGWGAMVVADAQTFRQRPALAVATTVLILGGLVGLWTGIEPYWAHPGWGDLADLPHGVDESGAHWIGATDPEVTIVEFSDYECPYCRLAHRIIRELVAKHRDKLRLVHRHLPLDQQCNERVPQEFHLHACRFSRAAECAGEQNRFWAMNDALFSVQDTVKSDDLDAEAVEKLAVRLGIDRSTFGTCMGRTEPVPAVARDLKEAWSKKIQGTPTYFIGERRYAGRIPESEIWAASASGAPATAASADD